MNLHVDTIMDWGPCVDYPRERIVELFGGEELDVMSISYLPIPPTDIIWALARPQVLGEKNARLFACDCAERVAHLGDEPVLRGVIEVARRYANGKATDEELKQAAKAADAAAKAADAAAGDATRAAAWAATAAREATTVAWEAWAAWAAWEATAAWEAEQEWQLDRLRHYLEAAND